MGRPRKETPGKAITEFKKRARSILWRQDPGRNKEDKLTYQKWEKLIKELEEKGGCTHHQAVIQASKEHACLKQLFRECEIAEFDPHPDSHPGIRYAGQPDPPSDIECLGIKQTRREDFDWAVNAAGKFLRAGEEPTTCPNDGAYFLYKQACEEPGKFLDKMNQIEMKSGDDLEEQRLARKSGKKSIDEIEEMLATIGSQ